MKKYFITGSGGFLGKHLLSRLNGDRYLYSRDQDLSILREYNPDYIIHCAAEIYKEDEMFDSNVVLTHRLLEEARKLKRLKGFIVTGSSSEYGRKDHATKETDFLDPQTMYEATKGAASLLCQTYARSYGVPVMVARPYSLYGKYEPHFRFIPTVIHNTKHNRKLSIAPGVHDFIHVDDFIDGLFLLLEKGKAGEIYNFGTGIQTSNEELVQIVENILGKEANKQNIPKLHDYDSNCWLSDCGKASTLGWKPKIGLTEGLSRVIKEINL